MKNNNENLKNNDMELIIKDLENKIVGKKVELESLQIDEDKIKSDDMIQDYIYKRNLHHPMDIEEIEREKEILKNDIEKLESQVNGLKDSIEKHDNKESVDVLASILRNKEYKCE